MACLKCEILFFTLRKSRKYFFFQEENVTSLKKVVYLKDGEMYFLAKILDISDFFINLL